MRSSLALILALCLAACGLLPEQVDETKGWSANKLYAEAKTNLNEGNYEKAIKLYEKLEARYPYGRYAQQAQLEIAYAYYKDKDVASAIAAADRFIKLHPNHPNVDYAYYLKGLANFNDDLGLLGSFTGQDMTERDPKAARESFDAFRDLVTRFPEQQVHAGLDRAHELSGQFAGVARGARRALLHEARRLRCGGESRAIRAQDLSAGARQRGRPADPGAGVRQARHDRFAQ